MEFLSVENIELDVEAPPEEPELASPEIRDYDQEFKPPPFEFPTLESTTEDQEDLELTIGNETGFESISLGLESVDLKAVQDVALEEGSEIKLEESEAPESSSSSTNPVSLSDSPPSTVQVSPSNASLPLPDTITGVIAGAEVGAATLTAEEEKSAEKLAKLAQDSVINSKRRPSALPGVISMTRQRDLPPKSKEEEKKHLKELDAMRVASKTLDKRRKSLSEAAAVARALVLSSALPTWETSILPNWRSVLRPDPAGQALLELWWAGTMPVRYRGRLWGMTIGNGLAVSKQNFSNCLKRVSSLQQMGNYPVTVLASIENDIKETMPLLKLFQIDGALYEDLKDLLLAYTVFKEGTPYYPTGISYPAAMLLINMSAAEAFLSLVNLVEKSFLKSFYSEITAEKEAYYRIFDTLLADTMPKVYANFSHLTQERDSISDSTPNDSKSGRLDVISPSLYLFPWLTTIFIKFLPLDLSTRIFDIFLLTGDSFVFRISLVLLKVLEPRLFNPILEELVMVFEGEDRGAISIVKRELGEEKVVIEQVYDIMGCKEDIIFALLKELDWKEETWERLVARELPEAD